jgi:nucleotide-binding universal stress UspA family protein
MEMNNIENILVNLDFTLLDSFLIANTSVLNGIFKAKKIYFVHVINENRVPEEYDFDFKIISEINIKKIKQEINEKIKQYFKNRGKTKIIVEVIQGRPVSEVLNFTEKENIDLIIVGNKKNLKGSGLLPNELARYSKCSVLFVPEKEKFTLTDLLLCNDYSKFSHNALEMAITIAASDPVNTTIHSQNIYYLNKKKVKAGQKPEELDDYLREKSMNQFNEFVSDLDLNETHINPIFSSDDTGIPQQVIQKTIEKRKIGMLLIGGRGRSYQTSVYLGSMAEKIIRSVNNVPVMIVKD